MFLADFFKASRRDVSRDWSIGLNMETKKTELEIPSYGPTRGMHLEWDDGFELTVRATEGEVVIAGNPAGLRSLARLLLTLAQDGIPTHHHVHLDESNALEAGSVELILERT
ncbi:MAG TPA: hypothetical protein VM759_10965 [Longimicrobium sp.]|nr:hypothetical protein [Longimicrobium sp.]